MYIQQCPSCEAVILGSSLVRNVYLGIRGQGVPKTDNELPTHFLSACYFSVSFEHNNKYCNYKWKVQYKHNMKIK